MAAGAPNTQSEVATGLRVAVKAQKKKALRIAEDVADQTREGEQTQPGAGPPTGAAAAAAGRPVAAWPQRIDHCIDLTFSSSDDDDVAVDVAEGMMWLDELQTWMRRS